MLEHIINIDKKSFETLKGNQNYLPPIQVTEPKDDDRVKKAKKKTVHGKGKKTPGLKVKGKKAVVSAPPKEQPTVADVIPSVKDVGSAKKVQAKVIVSHPETDSVIPPAKKKKVTPTAAASESGSDDEFVGMDFASTSKRVAKPKLPKAKVVCTPGTSSQAIARVRKYNRTL